MCRNREYPRLRRPPSKSRAQPDGAVRSRERRLTAVCPRRDAVRTHRAALSYVCRVSAIGLRHGTSWSETGHVGYPGLTSNPPPGHKGWPAMTVPPSGVSNPNQTPPTRWPPYGRWVPPKSSTTERQIARFPPRDLPFPLFGVPAARIRRGKDAASVAY
jgi:hypothetical protein